MIKIFLTVRNRLAMTKFCIEAMKRNTKIPFHLYIYDNLTNYKVKEHFQFMCELYESGMAKQIVFNTKESTFNAFSKAVAGNQFGLLHESDPEKGKYEFLLILDNDMILMPGWDEKILATWKFIAKRGMNNIQIVGQLPGGIKDRVPVEGKIGGCEAMLGRLGGSGLWAVKNDFFRTVGLLKIAPLIGHSKRQDSSYWSILDRASKGKPYILGLRTNLAAHASKYCGSTCNILEKNRTNKNASNLITFEEAEKKLDGMTFDEFYSMILKDKELMIW